MGLAMYPWESKQKHRFLDMMIHNKPSRAIVWLASGGDGRLEAGYSKNNYASKSGKRKSS